MAERGPTPAALRVDLLGDFRLLYGEIPVTFVNTPRLQALLAYLILHRHAPQSRRHLAFLFWPDSTEAQARNNLRQCLHLLKHCLPGADRFLRSDTQTVQWLPDTTFILDVAEFAAAIRLPESVAALQHAASLYRGELLPGCYDDWILPERERLQQDYIAASERLIRATSPSDAPRDHGLELRVAVAQRAHPVPSGGGICGRVHAGGRRAGVRGSLRARRSLAR